jgi:two-component system response regulator WspF
MAAEVLRRAVSSMPGHRIAWIAQDGAQAVERCREDLPDLILMDLFMPVIDGIEATRRIMKCTPCPILVVTGALNIQFSKVFEALSAGALDAVQTPVGANLGKLDDMGALKFKIDALLRHGARDSHVQVPQKIVWPELHSERSTDALVAIGASAGGPAALAAILGSFTREFPASIVIVQHLDVQFVPLMVAWLKERAVIPVRVARAGDHPEPGTALIAGTEHHLTFVSPQTLGYTPEPESVPFHPSVDVFFKSVVRHWKGKVAGVLLTGMGRDGAAGLKALYQSGALTIAQDAATSVVYGMPKAAVELNAAGKVLPLDRIGAELCQFFQATNAMV